MIGELIYTSARAGLRPGTSGFCTVAITKGLSKRDQLTLEQLSGYEFAFGISDPRVGSNPTCFLHTTVGIGAAQHVLSRVGFAGADHTGRSNKIAHHFFLAGSALPPSGPAAVMRHLAAQQRWATKWDEPARELEPWSLPTAISAVAGGTWSRVAGDQGWAGALARAFRAKPSVPAFVIFEPGTDVLALFEESLALLPSDERWEVCFSTYYSAALPPDRPCHWRGVLAGSAAAGLCGRHPGATIIDLTAPLPAPEEDEFTRAARQGQVVLGSVKLVAPPKSGKPPRKNRKAVATRASEPELVLELRAVEEEGPSRTQSFQFGRDYLISRSEKPSGLPAWVYLSAALLIGGVIVLTPILSRTPPEPPLPNKKTGKRPVEQSTLAQALPPAQFVTEPAKSGSDGQGSESQSSIRPIDITDSRPASEGEPSEVVSSALVEITSTTEIVEPPPASTAVSLQIRKATKGPLPVAHGATIAPIITPIETGTYRWRFTTTEAQEIWSAVHGRVGTHVKLESHQEKLTVRTGTQRIGSFALDRVGKDFLATFQLDARSERLPDPRLVESIVFELRTDGGLVLLPVRTLSPTRHLRVGFPSGMPFTADVQLSWALPAPLEFEGLRINFPSPRLHVKANANEETLPLPLSGRVEGSTLELDVEAQASGLIVVAVERKISRSLSERQSSETDVASSIAAVVSARSRHRDVGLRSLSGLSGPEKRALREQKQAAKRELEEAEDKPSFRWLQDLTDLAVRLDGTDIMLVDAWGTPLDRVRIEWVWGWLAPHLERLNEAEAR